jgi:deoxyribose-phosphate aldolase
LLKAGKIDEFHRELAQICEETNLTIKAIIESSLLSDAEKQLAAHKISIIEPDKYLKF